LKVGGYLRLSVPDKNFKNEWYQNMVQVGGLGPIDHPAATHNDYKTLTDMLQQAGFEVNLLEFKRYSNKRIFMIKIDKQDYINFYGIFSELGSYTFLLSSLNGIVNGELYSDDAKNPTYALMLTADLYYLVGDLRSEQCKQEIFCLSQTDVFLDYTGFIFSSKNHGRIKEIFGKHTYEFIERSNYKLARAEFNFNDANSSSNPNKNPCINTNSDTNSDTNTNANANTSTDANIEINININSDNLDIIRITPDNISKYKEYTNYKDVYDECKSYWDEYPGSSRINFANMLVMGNTILSYCYVCGESSSENSCEPGVETFEGFRRKGYAEAVCRETMKELFRLGYDKLNWHCHTHNIGSSKTAIKLGFKRAEDSHLAWFRKNIEV